MAQVTRRLILGALLTLLATTAFAQTVQRNVPAPALAAEMAGRWNDAITSYKAALDREPGRADLWVRLADVNARIGDLRGCIDALVKAVVAEPSNAPNYFRLSQAYSLNNDPKSALRAVDAAVVIAPDNVEYLEAQGNLDTWTGNYGQAQRAYRRVLALAPNRTDVALNLARVSAWSGDTDEAVGAYRRYLQAHGGDRQAWLELARTESWRGNYPAALDVLTSYKSTFGQSVDYARELAAVLARAGRPTDAEALVKPLLDKTPDNYELNLTRTIALAMQHRAREAFDSFDQVKRLQPASKDTSSAASMLRMNFSSSIEPGLTYYSDSDHLAVRRFAPQATLSLQTGTQLLAGYRRDDLHAVAGSGLEQLNGSVDARYEETWASAAQQFGRVTFKAQAGQGRLERFTRTTYLVDAEIRPADNVTLHLERNAGFFIISPRTAALGLTQVGHRVGLSWAPDARWMVSADGYVQRISDGNRRYEIQLGAHRSFARTQRLNLDLGVATYQLGTSRDLGNGYYDPRRYESYSAVVLPYFKLGENSGLGLTVAAGLQRDTNSPSLHAGGNGGAELSVGIYRPWVLKLRASATINRRLETGAFQGYSGGVFLVRRF